MKLSSRTPPVIRLTGMALLSALSLLAVMVFPLKVDFLTFDFKCAFLTIGAFAFGPAAAVLMSGTVSLLEMVLISTTGVDGFIMNFLSAAVFSAIPACLYVRRRRLSTALWGLCLGSLAMVAVMLAMNLIITPLYKGIPVSAVLAMIPTLLLPFNVIKAVANSAATLLLYKPMTLAMSRARMIPPADGQTEARRDPAATWAVLCISLVTLAVCAVLLFAVMGAGRK